MNHLPGELGGGGGTAGEGQGQGARVVHDALPPPA